MYCLKKLDPRVWNWTDPTLEAWQFHELETSETFVLMRRMYHSSRLARSQMPVDMDQCESLLPLLQRVSIHANSFKPILIDLLHVKLLLLLPIDAYSMDVYGCIIFFPNVSMPSPAFYSSLQQPELRLLRMPLDHRNVWKLMTEIPSSKLILNIAMEILNYSEWSPRCYENVCLLECKPLISILRFAALHVIRRTHFFPFRRGTWITFGEKGKHDEMFRWYELGSIRMCLRGLWRQSFHSHSWSSWIRPSKSQTHPHLPRSRLKRSEEQSVGQGPVSIWTWQAWCCPAMACDQTAGLRWWRWVASNPRKLLRHKTTHTSW